MPYVETAQLFIAKGFTTKMPQTASVVKRELLL